MCYWFSSAADTATKHFSTFYVPALFAHAGPYVDWLMYVVRYWFSKEEFTLLYCHWWTVLGLALLLLLSLTKLCYTVYIARNSVTVNHKYNVNSESQREENGGRLSPLVELTNSAPDICSSAPHWFSPAGGRDKSTVRTFNTFLSAIQNHRRSITGGIAWQKEKLRAVEIGQDVLLLYHDPHEVILADWSPIPTRNIRRIIIDRAGFDTDKKSLRVQWLLNANYLRQKRGK